jgi:2,3-bisphosphoglycerate-independent phosphoglycerate mutase
MGKKTVLMILDGWGHGSGNASDAIANAKTPFVDGLYQKYPNSELRTDGENVGLPDGQMGNSEVGHLNIGAGRVVFQDLLRINNAIKEGTFDPNRILRDAFIAAKEKGSDVHFIGLLSDGGVHSSQEHLYAICNLAKEVGVTNAYVHAFTDGRDTDPHGALGYMRKLEKELSFSGAKLASVVGRYYAMDRDRRWERIKLAYDLLVNGKGEVAENGCSAIERSYKNGVTDEFIKPISIQEDNKPVALVKKGDTVVCFNFRTDRCREISEALTQRDFPKNDMKSLDLTYVTMTNYDDSFKNVQVVYSKDALLNTLGEVLSVSGKSQLRIAETEKYPHVTYFFSGGREKVFKNEDRIMVPSPKVATYDMQPEMSAHQVTDSMLTVLEKSETDFVCLNFANPDMVGHTGDFEAVVKAVEVVDDCTSKIVEKGLENEYSFLIIADHGNADYLVNEDGTPNTAHSNNPVPCFLINVDDVKKLKSGVLADVAPTILKMMGVERPIEMTGKPLY